MVVVLIAEPCATHSQGSFLFVHGHTDTPSSTLLWWWAPRRPTLWQDNGAVSFETLSAGAQHSAHI